MGTKTVWAMQVQAHHKNWCYEGPMSACTPSCQEADKIIEEDKTAKNFYHGHEIQKLS